MQIRILTILLAIFAFFFLTAENRAPVALAQTSSPKLWITWRAATYIPPSFEGRALPIPNSKLVVAVDASDRGGFANLSSETIYWYLNDRFLTGGTGMTRVPVAVPSGTGGTNISIRAVLPDYGQGAAKTVAIPITKPGIVFEGPDDQVGDQFEIRAVPYYFSVEDPGELNFLWRISGKEPQIYKDPTLIRVTLGESVARGTSIPIKVRAENPGQPFEFATRERTLRYEP